MLDSKFKVTQEEIAAHLISFMVHLMSRLSPTLVKDPLKDFLYYRIENDSEYIEWAKDFTIPRYITDNFVAYFKGVSRRGCKAFYLDL